jgi:hypothetical protein
MVLDRRQLSAFEGQSGKIQMGPRMIGMLLEDAAELVLGFRGAA